MKRLVILILPVIMLLALHPAQARQYAAMIVDERTGKVLHAENPDLRVYPASLTKIMTLYMVFEKLQAGELKINQRLTASRRASRRPPSKLRLKAGDTITVRNAIQALITKSANDVATVIAESISGSESRFGILMTERAHQLGMTSTVFRNASGLPDKNQFTTARDMARLAIAIKRDFPKYFDLFSTREFKYGKRNYRNHNNLLRSFPGTTGIKTGYINASGFNLAVTVQRDGRRLIGVIFGGKTSAKRDRKMISLLNRTLKMLDQNERIVRRNAAIAGRSTPPSSDRRVSFKRTEAQADDGIEKSWGVQIGAYSRFAQAFLAANRAAEAAPGLKWARVSVQQSESRGKKFYRARLIELTQNRAMRVCRTLKQKRVACQVIQTKQDTAEGDR